MEHLLVPIGYIPHSVELFSSQCGGTVQHVVYKPILYILYKSVYIYTATGTVCQLVQFYT